MSISRVRRVAAVVLMVAAALLGFGLLSAANAAGSVSVNSSGKMFVTGGSEQNAFFVTGTGGGSFTVSDASGGAMSAGGGCSKSGSSVVCSGVTQAVEVSTGAGNDAVRLRSTNLPSHIHGGTGNDVLIGSSSGTDQVFGNDGDDNLSGSANDTLNGGNGTDKCSGVAAGNKVSCES